MHIVGNDMSDRYEEAERLRLARVELAQRLSKPLDFALNVGLPSEAALIALLINAILLNQTYELLEALRTTKPSA